MNVCRRFGALLFSFFAMLTASLHVDAQDPPAEQPWTINGFVSAAYTYNFDHPDSRANGYRVFDFRDDSFSLDVAELVVQKAVSTPGQAGFRADLVAGSSVPSVSAAYGLFRDETTGKAQDFDLQQAFVSYIAPLGRGLRIDAGKFITNAGAEVIEGYDGYNDNYSRSLLFGYAIPFTHTGVKATYGWSDKLSTTAMVINGWDVARDNNSGKSLGLSVAFTPSPAFTTYVNYIGGAERADSSDVRHLIDLVSVVKLGGRTTLTFNYDYAREKNAVGAGHDAKWNGLAVYIRQDFTRFALAARAEVFNDSDGVRTGTAQRLSELTLTPSAKFGAHLVVRGDLRLDRSDQAAFEGGRDRQTTAAVNVLYSF